MQSFTQYLTESTKVYDYRIKVAGEIDKGFANKLETAMSKWDCQSLSSGKTTPIVELPLDFPHLKNEIVTMNAQEGSILIEDTLGLHKGQKLDEGNRLVLQIQYSSNLFGSKEIKKIKFPNRLSKEFLTPPH